MVTTERYVKILENDPGPVIRSDSDFENIWITQDGAPFCQT